MRSGSFKPSSMPLRPRRPSIARTSSASSTKSQHCASPLSAPSPAADLSESVQQNSSRLSAPDTQRIARSRPIAIELPLRRRGGQVYTPTPPEPLSARGDLLGGYFPLHEESQRSYIPHPFHLDHSFSKGTSQPMPEPRSPLSSSHSNAMTDTPNLSESYRVPTIADPALMATPLGKYHPSNYKNKSKAVDKLAPLASPIPNQPHHARKKSDIKKKLQQYQRDMVEQAALAGHIPFPGSKPISPRLLPLGSPGPVTPMELEESASYMGVGTRALSQSELMAKMSRAADEASRREK